VTPSARAVALRAAALSLEEEFMDHPVARLGRRTAALAVATCATLSCGALTAAAQARTTHPAKPTVTASTPVTPGSDYLALGDSVSFGYMEPTVVPAPDYPNAASFHGYPEMLGSELHLKVANAACPGETSSSLLNAGAQSNGCENTVTGSGVSYRKAYPLHVKYSGSQIAYAEKYLKSHSDTRLVSLMIGANDLFACEETTSDGCLNPAEQAPVLAKITKNVHTILTDLRSQAHYAGQIVIVDYYSLNYASATINDQSEILNKAQAAGAKGFKVRFANAYTTFATASAHSGDNTCTAGLLTQLGAPGTCGVHPSYAGQALLASTLENAIAIR
jgi:lysophospholipase L1-like esterase